MSKIQSQLGSSARRWTKNLLASAGLIAAGLGAISAQADPGTLTFVPNWTIDPGNSTLTPTNGVGITSATTRSICVTPSTNVLVISRITSFGVYRLSGTNGSIIGALNTNGITSATITLNKIFCADDGAVYACNLAGNVNTGAFKVYKWQSETDVNPPTVVVNFTDASALRFGDHFAVKGAGANTEFIVAGNSANAKQLHFKATDAFATNFTGRILATGVESSRGIAFGGETNYFTRATGT